MSGFAALSRRSTFKDLGAKIKRGQNGLVAEGKVPGVVTYGYDRVLGKPAERVINEDEAKIVRRIFREYAAGASPRAIAAGLTRDGIPSPSGSPIWNFQTLISGGGKKHGGILSNPLYIGKLIWNQHRTVRNPDTGAESKRARPQSDHIVKEVPHLRIVDQKLWDAAQAARKARSEARIGDQVISRPTLLRAPHLLSGLLRCGVCNGHMIVCKLSLGKRYVMCAAAFQRSACTHRKSYVLETIQQGVIDGMRQELTDPQAIAKEAKVYHQHYAELAKKNGAERAAVERKRNRLVVQIDRIVTAISDSDEPLPTLLASLKAKEAERVGLEERIRLLGAETNVVSLHPNVIEAYKATIEKLHEALVRKPDDPSARAAIANLIDSVVVHPTEYRAPYDISVYGRLSAIMGVNLFPTKRTNREILKSEGVSCGESVHLD